MTPHRQDSVKHPSRIEITPEVNSGLTVRAPYTLTAQARYTAPPCPHWANDACCPHRSTVRIVVKPATSPRYLHSTASTMHRSLTSIPTRPSHARCGERQMTDAHSEHMDHGEQGLLLTFLLGIPAPIQLHFPRYALGCVGQWSKSCSRLPCMEAQQPVKSSGAAKSVAR